MSAIRESEAERGLEEDAPCAELVGEENMRPASAVDLSNRPARAVEPGAGIEGRNQGTIRLPIVDVVEEIQSLRTEVERVFVASVGCACAASASTTASTTTASATAKPPFRHGRHQDHRRPAHQAQHLAEDRRPLFWPAADASFGPIPKERLTRRFTATAAGRCPDVGDDSLPDCGTVSKGAEAGLNHIAGNRRRSCIGWPVVEKAVAGQVVVWW